MILRLALPLVLCTVGSALAQVNTNDSLMRRDTVMPQQSTSAPPRRAPDPQLGEKLGRIDADLRDAKTPEERSRLQAERARLLQESTGEEMTIQTGPVSNDGGSSVATRQPDGYDQMENSNPEAEVVEIDHRQPATTSASSERHTALPSRTASVRTAPAASTRSTVRSTSRTSPPPRRTVPAPAPRAVPSRSVPRVVERQEVRESGSALERASTMAKRGQRTEARRTLINYLRRNPRSPQAVEARKLLQTL